MENVFNIFSFILFVTLGAVLPGTFLTSLFLGKSEKKPELAALSAIALLSGFIFQIIVWAALRWACLDYNAILALHAAFILLLAFFALRDKAGRDGCAGIVRSVYSADTAVFLIAAVALAAYLTYGRAQLYYIDEIVRMSLAWAAQKSIPAQNIFVWTGVIKYYYAAEFFAGSASAVTKTPIETVYFRYMLPLNWTLLYFGIRGILAQYKPDFKRYIPHAAFLLFFLTYVKMLANFTFRQNTFAFGLSVLAVSALWTALSSGASFPLVICGLAPAFITFVKAPCGALYLLFLWVAVVLGSRSGLLERKKAATIALFGTASWFLACRSLSGGGFQGMDSLFTISPRPGWLKEFLPEYILNPALLDMLSARPDYLGGLLVDGLKILENVLTVLVSGILPLTAAALWLNSAEKRGAGARRGAAVITLVSAAVVFMAGTLLFCFVHYKISNGSDSYWLFFPAWILGAIAFPLFLAELDTRLLPRVMALCALVPFIELIVSLPIKPGSDGIAVLAIVIAMAVAAVYIFYSRLDIASGSQVGKVREKVIVWSVFFSGILIFFLAHYRLGANKEWWFLPAWILSAAAYPLFNMVLESRISLHRAAFLAIMPLLVALSHAPKYLYWAADWKFRNTEIWTQNNQEACSVLNSREGSSKVYLHNILDRYSFTLAAMCRGRMYASFYSEASDWADKKGVWEDTKVYSAARAEADGFFNGKTDKPCAWLKERSIGYVYWDTTGSVYKFPELVKNMKFLTKIYDMGNVALYRAGPCEEKAP